MDPGHRDCEMLNVCPPELGRCCRAAETASTSFQAQSGPALGASSPPPWVLPPYAALSSRPEPGLSSSLAKFFCF